MARGFLSMIYFSQLSEITGGKNLHFYKDSPVESIVIDSRKAFSQSSTLFFAIKGERNDGHEYISELYQQGVRQFVVEHPFVPGCAYRGVAPGATPPRDLWY